MGKGVSLGKEAVLAVSEKAGEIAAGVKRARRTTFSVFCYSCNSAWTVSRRVFISKGF